jgi:hypothetical protein
MLMKTSSQHPDRTAGRAFCRAHPFSRLLPAGARLPSVRECARQQGVSPYTVVAAYDQLLAQGLVEARSQRGFYVRDFVQNGAQPKRDKRKSAMNIANSGCGAQGGHGHGVVALRFAHQRHGADPGHVPPGVTQAATRRGRVPPDWLETGFMPAAVRKVTGSAGLQEGSLQYGEPMGDPGLRQVLARKLAGLNIPGAARADHDHRGRHPCAGHREPHAAAGRRPGDGRGARLVGGVCPPGCPGHAHPARTAPRRRPRSGGDGALLRGPRGPSCCERERVPQPDGLLPVARQRAPGAAAGTAAQLSHRRGRHLQPHRARNTPRGCRCSTACGAPSM